MQEGTAIAGIVAAFALASWWPLVVAVPMATLGWYGLLLWSSPLAVVQPARAVAARRNHLLIVAGFIVLVIVAGLASKG
ncbi:hypothetical protein [Longimicrobium terrae]|uniref:Uncharacterized protein n=1 Tax=Longimicrobium terrae TaxID=1639882 RepID=A0A841H525_9BACT|nr:hypothetical protein [Longimicrobium terrae]MBB4638938.1 hypothetical protein [Longimicrobium terrae]MBB6073177.1 hypothetical protein [Longimicrobium terrae]NNC32367.1 hypothetical protein [Longimicrobium terrae]